MILKNREKILPELLAPAGGYSSLEAAVCSGADAVYLGTKSYNARMNASNFSDDELISACGLCHAHGMKVYVTLNTQLYDREIFPSSNDSETYTRGTVSLLKRVEFLYNTGVDAIISADVGVSSLIHSEFPDFPIHASTQASGHGALSAEFLKKLGFTRMVCARELSKNDIESLVKNSDIEIEMFIHGAHCVSYSGQCLMSWAMGGRSGNRGECAQPCRLPYEADSENKYPLSLKDMSLASHITELIDIGVSSLKIEGRMKSPSYVYGVTKIYRQLLDENRNANPDEMRELASYFSRSGFSDGYFIGKTNASMLGIRSESDKEESRNKSSSSLYSGLMKKVPVEIEVSVKKDAPSEMTMKSDFREVTVFGDIPMEAVNAPLSENDVIKNISKLGQTPFTVEKIKADVGENLILPVSRLNFLRRSACDEMLKTEREIHFHRDDELLIDKEFFSHRKTVFSDSEKIQTAEFLSESQITDAALKYFKIRFIPVEKFQSGEKANGISLPPVIFDSEIESVTQILKNARECGINHIMISNTGHIDFVRNLGFSAIQIHGSFRLNVFNSYTAEILGKAGLSSYTLSPELILPQMRDIGSANENMGKSVIIYGKIPLMYVQRCVINNRKSDGKGTCGRSVNDGCVSVISDRTGAKMNIYGSFGHRNTIYNSVPIYMADKTELTNITGAGMHHFIFSSESCEEINKIINSYRQNLPSGDKIKRINNR